MEGVVIEEYNGEGVLARTIIYARYASRQKSSWICDHSVAGANFLHGYGTSHVPCNQVASPQQATGPSRPVAENEPG
jgi:hypothetical protein